MELTHEQLFLLCHPPACGLWQETDTPRKGTKRAVEVCACGEAGGYCAEPWRDLTRHAGGFVRRSFCFESTA